MGSRFRDIGLHRRGEGPGIQATGEAPPVEADFDGVRDQLFALEVRLGLEEPAMIRPVLAPLGRAARRFVRGAREVVDGEREVLEDQPDLAVVFAKELFQRPLDAPAVRSLVIGELDDRHRGVGGAARHRWIHGEGPLGGGPKPRRGDQEQREDKAR